MKMSVTVSAKMRETRGKNEARRLRAAGLVPAVVYGSNQPSLALSVDPKQVVKILHSSSGHNTIFDVRIEGGETTPVMLVDWQFDPVKGSLLHADLKRIDLSKRLRVSVPVQTEGEPVGVKTQGGLLEIVNREIEIECLPADIPEHFTVNVADLAIGQARRAAEIALSGSMRLVSHGDAVIAHVVALRAEAEAAPAAAAEGEAPAPAEPEVIKKGKKEEEGGEAEEKGKKK